MGSEHYCLRWNNHQSNLLGVFSQLLQDESLVDVTLACSEGTSIRAHKVVLSACSSYFQSLFLDHPSRHPIVILKDVRFAELRTIIEFMYKGEVNVQYCQLSALLKTAESLKVKGLAEMTNQSSALREPEREQDHLRPPTHLTPKSESLDATVNSNSSKRLKPERNTPTPPPQPPITATRAHQQQSSSSSSPSPSRNRDQNRSTAFDRGQSQLSSFDQDHQSPSTQSQPQQSQQQSQHHYQSHTSSSSSKIITNSSSTATATASSPSNNDADHQQQYSFLGRHVEKNYADMLKKSADSKKAGPPSRKHDDEPAAPRPPIDEDENMDDDDDDAMSNDNGINMTINSHSLNSSPVTTSLAANASVNLSMETQAPPSTSSSIALRSESIVGHGSGNGLSSSAKGSFSGIITTTSTCTSVSSGLVASSSGMTSPILSEPIAGPSGLGPVQSVPLSLKKEMDWDRSDEKSIGESSSDYRHPHDSEATSDTHHGLSPHDHGGSSSNIQIYQCMYCGATFPHQSKLTRHILSHSLETLKYREASHLLHLSSFPHDLPPQHFSQRSSTLLDQLDPSDALDVEYVAAAAAAAAAIGSGGSNSSGGGGGGGNGTSGDQANVVLCKFCGKSFPDVSSLITHLPVHTGDRPFKCEFCGKAFKLRHHMKDHCRVHTGERPFRCSMCGKTFSRSTILKAHEKTHYPKYVRKFLSPSPVDGKEEPPQ